VRSREALLRRAEELRSLSIVGEAISSSMSVDDLLMIVYRECRKLLDNSLFYVALYDAERRSFRIALLAEGDEVLEGTDIPQGEGFESIVYHTRRPIIFRSRAELLIHPHKRWKPVGRVQAESYVWAPMVTQDGVLGVVCAQHTEAGRYDEENVQALTALAHQAAVALENIRLFRKATTDNLTGLFLRAYFDKKLEEQLFKARRYGYRVSMMLLDLDNFKQINDTLGHAAGDVVLQEVGQTIGHSIRVQDVAARYGGDEFAVLLPGIPVEGCLEVAARIKGRVEALNFPVLARTGNSRITISIGIATVAPDSGTDLASLYETADHALYEAKRTGKNRVLARDEKLA
jgi:diguanylate cyclase (GGDEF)-like protein